MAFSKALRGGALGVAFKRQVPLGDRYIADFSRRRSGSSWRSMAPLIVALAPRIAGAMKGFGGSVAASCVSTRR